MENSALETINWTFSKKMQSIAGLNISHCYQCKKCTSGCPVIYEMDYSPSQIIHAACLGLKDLVFRSKTIWLCASCQTCSTRCPQEVDIAQVMDTLRIMVRKEAFKPAVREIPAFNRSFLQTVRIFGRSFEAGMTLLLKLRTGEFRKDMDMGFKLIKKGKLKLIPGFTRFFEINRIFSRVHKMETY